MTLLSGDRAEVDALVTDRYLEALLRGPGPSLLPDAAGPGHAEAAAALDDAVRVVSASLLRDLPRFHPSFRFEERLALRLAEAAAAMRRPMAAGAEGAATAIPFPYPRAAMDPHGVQKDIFDRDCPSP